MSNSNGIELECPFANYKIFPIKNEDTRRLDLVCGEMVRKHLRDSRFVIRINSICGNESRFIDMSINDFRKINRAKEHLTHLDGYRIRLKNLEITPADKKPSSGDLVLEFNQRDTQIAMYCYTFETIMCHKAIVENEYAEYKKRNELYDDVLNLMAYVRNQERSNNQIKKPLWFSDGMRSTLKKLLEQIDKSKTKMNMRENRNYTNSRSNCYYSR